VPNERFAGSRPRSKVHEASVVCEEGFVMTWSIRLKFLFVMCGLLTLCMGSYLFMAITVFKSDKTQLVFDLNRSQVSNLTSEIETQFTGVSDKLKLFAMLPEELQNRMKEDLFSDGSDIVAVGVFNTQGDRTLRFASYAKFEQTYGLAPEFFPQVLNEHPVPFLNILKQGQDVWNASPKSGPPLIGYGRLVVLQDANGKPVDQWAVVGFVRLDRFIKSVSSIQLSQVYVANQRGEILVHPDSSKVLTHPSVIDDAIFKEAIASKAKLSLVDRTLDGAHVLAAYSKGFDDQIFVVAKANGSEVFRVVQDFTIRTFLFGSIVLTLVVLAAFLLSAPITQNIGALVDRMALVSQGDLTSPIVLKSRDETVTLANTFNQMIHDLRESRDALEEMNRELDQKVKERTAQLEEQNKKVKEVQEALIRTTRLASVGEIAGRTAHEVLNPLTILLTRLGLMQKRVTKNESLELMDEIRQAWKRDFHKGGFPVLLKNWQSESQIIPKANLFQEDLENFEKISQEIHAQGKDLQLDIQFIKNEGERIGKIINGMRRLGHLKSEAQETKLHQVLSDCCHIMADLFDEKTIAIVQEFKAEDDIAAVDRDEVIQAFTNLMRNSLQALEDAQKTNPDEAPFKMILRTHNESDGLVIEFEDNGIGIPEENHARLFESSFTTKSPDQGTGLGLGISRRFIRSNGGDIEFLQSKPFQKTVFRVRLPLAAARNKGAVA
jgi:signal transduction histidine kinase